MSFVGSSSGKIVTSGQYSILLVPGCPKVQSIDLLYRLFVEPSWKRINTAISRQEMSYFDGCNGVSLIYLSVMVAKIHTTLLRLWNTSHPSLILTTFSIDLWRISFFIFISTFIPFIAEKKHSRRS